MTGRDFFGPRLRRAREHRKLTLEEIARQTNVGVELWQGLERNDLSRWPSGVMARAFVRAYAEAVGLDSDETVNEFCRLFPQGDRRAERVLRAHAELIGEPSKYRDDFGVDRPEHDRRERRSGPIPARRATDRPQAEAVTWRWRLAAASVDLALLCVMAGLCAPLFGVTFFSAAGMTALPLQFVTLAWRGCSTGTELVAFVQRRRALQPDVHERLNEAFTRVADGALR